MISNQLLRASIMVCLAVGSGLVQPALCHDETQISQAPIPGQATLPVQPSVAQVVEGPLLAERQALREKIKAAEGKGIGIKPYLMAFDALEATIKTGATGEGLQKRVESISRGLDDQLKRSDDLKKQRPAPPISASSPPPSAMSGGGGGQARGGNQGNLVEALKNKWLGGGEIPESIKSKIPSNIDPNKLKQEDVDALLKQLK